MPLVNFMQMIAKGWKRHKKHACNLLVMIRLILFVYALAICLQVSLASSPAPKGISPKWIWQKDKTGDAEVFLRRQWQQKVPVKSAILRITGDDQLAVHLNGNKIGSVRSWKKPLKLNLTKRIAQGHNVIAVSALNLGGLGGVVAILEIVEEGGLKRTLVTDEQWMVNKTNPDGWMTTNPDGKDWVAATIVGSHGVEPWGNILTSAGPAKKTAKRLIAAQREIGLKIHPGGFVVEKLFDVDVKTQGSWVSMAVDDQGRLYCGDQGDKGIFRLTLNGSKEPKIEKIPAEISGAQGLLWLDGTLYAGINKGTPENGMFRIIDGNGDGQLDKVELMRKVDAKSEHGNHAVVASPDGKSLFFVAGNNAPPPTPETSAVPPNYGEDQLLPILVDPRGHARTFTAPGGWIAQTDPSGKNYRLFSAGFRNQYDAAFNAHGELFTYDADMEWDLGAPWYRPTRIYHVTSGSEFGWRKGSGKFPEWFPDVLPPALDIGPGSPTGMVSGLGAKFPAKYQNAIYAFDWTYGTIYALHQHAEGASYRLEKEEFVTGAPLPLTDGVVSPDGNLYFAVGGRGTPSAVYRVKYIGKQSTSPAPAKPGKFAKLRALRKSLEAYHRKDSDAIKAVWPYIGHGDRFVRFAARIAIEHQPVESWIDRAADGPEANLCKLLAIARQGKPKHSEMVISNISKLWRQGLSANQMLAALRIANIAMVRLGDPAEATKKSFAELVSSKFPSADARLNREAAYSLIALQSPDALVKTVPLLSQEPLIRVNGPKIDKAMLERSSKYGAAVSDTLSSAHQTQQIWYAYLLRQVKDGWTKALRREYFQWFAKAQSFKGGNSFQGFIENTRQEALINAPKAERKALSDLSKKAVKPIPDGFSDARRINVGVLPGLKFNTDIIDAEAGEKVAIIFQNNDPAGMMHNLAIITPGSSQKVIAAAVNMGSSGMANNFIPEIPELLASTPQVGPGMKYTLYFEVPNKTGEYHFICTYPGHGLIMQGIFSVK